MWLGTQPQQEEDSEALVRWLWLYPLTRTRVRCLSSQLHVPGHHISSLELAMEDGSIDTEGMSKRYRSGLCFSFRESGHIPDSQSDGGQLSWENNQ